MKRAVTAICVTGAASLTYVGIVTTHAIGDPHVIPSLINTAVLTTLAISFLSSLGWALVLRVEAGQRRQAARAERRYETVRTALVSLGADVAETTGELRRMGSGSWEPRRVDPTTMRMLREIDRTGIPPWQGPDQQ